MFKKNKTLIIFFVLICITTLFADTPQNKKNESINQFSVNYSIVPENNIFLLPLNSQFNSENLFANTSSFAGFNIDYTHLNKVRDSYNFGFNTSFSMNFFDNLILSNTNQYSKLNLTTGLELFLGFAPDFNFIISPRNTLSLRPGLCFNFIYSNQGTINSGNYYYNFFTINCMIQNQINYNFWFYNKNKLKLGLNIQGSFNIPIAGYAKYTSYFTENYFTFGTDCLTLSAGIGVQF